MFLYSVSRAFAYDKITLMDVIVSVFGADGIKSDTNIVQNIA